MVLICLSPKQWWFCSTCQRKPCSPDDKDTSMPIISIMHTWLHSYLKELMSRSCSHVEEILMSSPRSYLPWQPSPFPQLHQPENEDSLRRFRPLIQTDAKTQTSVTQLDSFSLDVLRTRIIQRSLKLYQGNIITVFWDIIILVDNNLFYSWERCFFCYLWQI